MEEVETLVLDRFVNHGHGRGVDLATGAPVWFHLESLGPPERQQRRARAAAVLAAVRHWSLWPLLDFGVDQRGVWVEAYGQAGRAPNPPWSDGYSLRLTDTARRVLAAAGLLVAASHGSPLTDADSRPASWPGPVSSLLPADEAGVSAVGGEADGRGPAVVATSLQRRAELDQLIDVLDDDRARGVRRFTIGAGHGAGLRSLFELFARDARLRGFVPVASAVCAAAHGGASGPIRSAVLDLLRHRHVVILDDRRGEAFGVGHATRGAADLLLRLGGFDGRPHLVVCAVGQGDADASLRLQPLEPAALRRAVLVAGVPDTRVATALTEALRTSCGWPGPFMAALATGLGLDDHPFPTWPRDLNGCVAESLEPVTATPPVPPPSCTTRTRGGAVRPSWRADASLRRAQSLVAHGRHASAERLLRRSVGALRRRSLHAEAGRAALQLGRLYTDRGRLAAAAAVFDECRLMFARAQHSIGEVAALLHAGAVATEEGRLSAAESALRTALIAAEQGGWLALADAARAHLARCLLWQGMPGDVGDLLARIQVSARNRGGAMPAVAEQAGPTGEPGPETWANPAAGVWTPAGTGLVPVEVAVRSAIARRDLGSGARSLRTCPIDPETDEPGQAARRRVLDVLMHGALGDVPAARRELVSGLRQARQAHLPGVAMELRTAFVQGCIESGDLQAASRSLSRLDRLGSRAPGLIRLRLIDLRARVTREAQGGASGQPEERVDAAAVLSVLRHCQDADDDTSAVEGVCEALRSSLGAAAVTAWLGAPDSLRVLAKAGGRSGRPDIVERGAGALAVVGPEATAAGVEAAAAIRQGGRVVGGLSARWPADASPEAGKVRGLLAAAAAAVGPACRALAVAAPAREDGDGPAGDLCGGSGVMADVRRQVLRAAAAPFAVLIEGESGTGKELIARAIHRASARRARRFCALNCAALNDELFETELFGHARGAFTGAAADRPGLFEDADGGTLFLDEVGELSPRAQAKLLRAIQEGEVRRVGENHPRRVDARIVAATNRSLADDAREGRFRQDLLFRLDVVRIRVPSLREHPEDIPELALRFWRESLTRTGGRAELAPATVAALARYDWPGNVRELQNVLAALAVHAPHGGRVGPSRLPETIARGGAARHDATTLAQARRRFEERYVRATLARSGGRRTEAAATLGITRQGLAKMLERLGIEGGAAPSS